MRKPKSHKSEEIFALSLNVLEHLQGAIIAGNCRYGESTLQQNLHAIREQVLFLAATCPRQ